jgi:uncharacterized membrane protein YozB (DUF420 family)
MKNFITISLMIFITFLPEVLLAHPGHGGHEGGYTIIHYFIEPMHAVLTIGCIVAVIAFVRMGRKKSKQ